ncbi:alpha-ketoglutarate-dependent dioxygenase AlkB family protein [Enhygromyxa salina]|uniref:2OG-Fe(II) oxygenase superfamily protein n=1 Tax=Enhygromyxa salina TaxID=215803 RepID=A0A2S9Y3K4_9BACT|nr:alpha-ketoglutarate-dependent dioxygenase AlkB [Enhygromyxa salina]PRP99676.1 2OG-Fe(II) oxygenase superfamily protein [Enhygromyxa salina]
MTQAALFAHVPASAPPVHRWEAIAATGASIWLRRDFLPPQAATKLLGRLIDVVPWRHDKIRVFGKEHDLPRLQQWYGDPGQVYVWSGIEMQPLPWAPEIAKVRDAVQRATKRKFNSVLLNYYRDGNDTVGWHSDDEPGLGLDPFIASVSVGVERDFVLRRIGDPKRQLSVSLSNGSLLVMSGQTQATWQHAVPRRKRVKGPRVNLTFREFE